MKRDDDRQINPVSSEMRTAKLKTEIDCLKIRQITTEKDKLSRKHKEKVLEKGLFTNQFYIATLLGSI